MYGVFQVVGLPKRILSDNGAAFRKKQFLKLMSALGIIVSQTASQFPAEKGFIERQVKSSKDLIRKILNANLEREDNRVDILPFLTTLMQNQQYNTRIQAIPTELVFGERLNDNGLTSDNLALAQPHPLLLRGHKDISQLNSVINNARVNMQRLILEKQKLQQQKVTGHIKQINVGDVVYVLDQRPPVIGINPVWRSTYMPTVFIVSYVYNTKAVLLKLSDGTTSVKDFGQIKRYTEYPEFEALPSNLQQLFNGHFNTWTQEQIDEIVKSQCYDWSLIDSMAEDDEPGEILSPEMPSLHANEEIFISDESTDSESENETAGGEDEKAGGDTAYKHLRSRKVHWKS